MLVHLLSLSFSFNSIISAGPWKTKNSHRGWSDVRINTSKYNCWITQGAVGFRFPASAWNSKNKESILILVLLCALFTQSKPSYESPCKIQRLRHITSQIEQKAWLFVSSLATAHQVEDNKWIWTWNTVTVVCFVIQFMVIISLLQHSQAPYGTFSLFHIPA